MPLAVCLPLAVRLPLAVCLPFVSDFDIRVSSLRPTQMIDEVREQLKQLDQSRDALKKYGYTMTGALAVLGALLHFLSKRHPNADLWLWGAGAAFLVVSLVAPTLLKPLHFPWMALTYFLGAIMNRVVLSVVFFLAVTPIAILARLFRGDFLHQKLDPDATTYWIKREAREFDPQKCERKW